MLPYVYGGVTGASVALVVLMGAFVLRDRSDARPVASLPSGAVLTAADGTVASVGEGRRNAIVVATQLVAPAVVSISVAHEQTVAYWEIYRHWDRFFRRPRERTQISHSFGSGVVVDERGYIFTNAHVVGEGVTRIAVTLKDGRELAAELVGKSPKHDLALLRVDPDVLDVPLPVARLGNSDDLLVGEWAIAIGSPFGQYLADNQPTVTVGVISALHRDIRQGENEDQVFSDMIQTDAAINPGNSGGPLVNARGEVVGINAVIFSGARNATFNIGLGFAIPVNRVRYVFGEILDHGKVREQWVGMMANNITPQMQVALGLPVERGVLVQGIEAEGPADRAGLKPGDVLISIDGITVANTDHANRLIFAHAIGESVEMTISRDDKLQSFRVRIDARPSSDV